MKINLLHQLISTFKNVTNQLSMEIFCQGIVCISIGQCNVIAIGMDGEICLEIRAQTPSILIESLYFRLWVGRFAPVTFLARILLFFSFWKVRSIFFCNSRSLINLPSVYSNSCSDLCLWYHHLGLKPYTRLDAYSYATFGWMRLCYPATKCLYKYFFL